MLFKIVTSVWSLTRILSISKIDILFHGDILNINNNNYLMLDYIISSLKADFPDSSISSQARSQGGHFGAVPPRWSCPPADAECLLFNSPRFHPEKFPDSSFRRLSSPIPSWLNCEEFSNRCPPALLRLPATGLLWGRATKNLLQNSHG